MTCDCRCRLYIPLSSYSNHDFPVTSPIQFYRDRIHQDLACPEIPDNCKHQNGGCEDECIQVDEKNHYCKCKPGSKLADDGKHCKNCGHIRADIVFVLDSSNSISFDSFYNGIHFVTEFMDFLKRVGMIEKDRVTFFEEIECEY